MSHLQGAPVTPHGTWLLWIAALGVFFAADDQTSVVALLPPMLSDIGLPVHEFYRASWVVNGYLLGYLVALPLVGRISDAYGHGRVFAAVLAIFMLGSALVAVAPSFEWLVVARALQAIGGGGVVPVAMAIVVDGVPASRRTLGLGAIAAAAEAGALIGPLWGGGLADLAGWRWVFWINLPMTAPLAYGAWRFAPHRGYATRDIDWLGALVLGAALTLLTVALVDDPNARRAPQYTVLLLAGAAACVLLFLRHERRSRVPLVRLAMFRPRPVWAASLTSLVVGGGLIAVLIAVPLFVNLVLGETPLSGGLTLMRLTVAVPIGALAGGWLATRYGLQRIAVLGMLCAAIGIAGLRGWDAQLTQLVRTVPQWIAGLGFGLVIAPLGSAVLQHVREDERATASSWLTLARLVGMLIGAALLTSTGLGRFYARVQGLDFTSPEFEQAVAGAQVSTFRDVFTITAFAMALAVLPAWLIGRGRTEPIDAEQPIDPWWTLV